mgnify:CR=1 FL=1
MTKILILSYYYEPANFVACERVHSWAKYFKENDLYPIIVTRQWNEGQTDIVDPVNNNKLNIIKYDGHEVHYLPHKNSLRNKLAYANKLSFIRKILSFSELLTERILFRFSKNYIFYAYTHRFLKKNQGIKIIIASGRPFYLFKVASLLALKNKVKWIADYRDEWTTIYPKPKLSLINKLLFSLEKINERKWIDSSAFFTTTSEPIKNRISKTHNKKGLLVYNGYDGEVLKQISNQNNSNELNILYAGTLYSYQNIDLLIDSVKKINCESSIVNINMTYVGVEIIPSELKKLEHKINNDTSFTIIPKMNYEDLTNLYHEMDILYLTSYEQNEGWLPVKLFDYYRIGKPVLLYPSDNGVMRDFIMQSNSGLSCSNHLEFEKFITKFLNNKVTFIRNEEFGRFYSRKYQAKLFCAEIKKIL